MSFIKIQLLNFNNSLKMSHCILLQGALYGPPKIGNYFGDYFGSPLFLYKNFKLRLGQNSILKYIKKVTQKQNEPIR